MFFSGGVIFVHQGTRLQADTVVFYQKENYARAISNVILATPDGTRITASEMNYDGNTQRGIADKNVVFTSPQQTIRTQRLYYDRRANTAYFDDGGSIESGGNLMKTKSARYYIHQRRTDFNGDVNIDNPEYNVESQSIQHNTATNTAIFNGATLVKNKANPSNYVYTERGRYNMNTKEVWLTKKSRIHYQNKILEGEEMYLNQTTGFGKAKGNVRLNDPAEKRFIHGGYGEIYQKKDSAMITEKPYAVKALRRDSVYFAADKILAYQRKDKGIKKSFLRGYRKVRLYKTDLQARADSLSFNETDGVMHLTKNPIAWNGYRQVTGDEIKAYFNPQNQQTDSLHITGNAFAIAKVDSTNQKDEFHQIQSHQMRVYFQNGKITQAIAQKNAQAIHYAEDEKSNGIKERLGIGLSKCGNIHGIFEEQKLYIVECNIGAQVDVYPMSQISHEQRFLSGFNWNTQDRLRKWQDIFLLSPNYPQIIYESDDKLYLERKNKEKPKPPDTPKARPRR